MPEQSASTGASKPPIRTVVVPSLAAFRLEPGEAVYEVNGEALPLHVYGKFAGSGVPLIVFGQGMVQRSVVQMPRFQRMNWADRFPENVLVLNDPTLYLADDMALGWMIGTEQHNVLLRIVALVRQVQAQLGIQDRNILFYGSSAGGFASLMLSAHFQDPAVFVNNPQTDVLKFRRGGVRRLLELGFGGMTVAEAAERHGARFSYPEALRQGARLPRLYYLQNIFDRDHYKDQLLPLLAQLTLSPEANTEQFVDRRLVLDLYADPKTEHNPLGLSRTLACMDIVRPWIAVGGAAPRGGP